MELRKVLEIFNYKGDMWYINPYIENGKIVRNTTYRVRKNRRTGWGSYTFENSWGKGAYYHTRDKEVSNEDEIRVYKLNQNENIDILNVIKGNYYYAIDNKILLVKKEGVLKTIEKWLHLQMFIKEGEEPKDIREALKKYDNKLIFDSLEELNNSLTHKENKNLRLMKIIITEIILRKKKKK